jgi:vancomycin resistance protein VanJ
MITQFPNPLLKQVWTIAKGFFWAGLWLFALGLLTLYPMRWWPGDRFWPVRLTNYLMPWLLVALVPALIVAGVARRRWLVTALAVPSMLIGLTFAPLFLPRLSPALAGNDSLSVMSYNIWGWNRNIEAMAEVIRQEQPDFILLQEVHYHTARRLKAALRDLYPEQELHVAFEPSVSQAIFSRYPLIPVETSVEKGRTQKIVALTPYGSIAVWNVHLYQPLPWFSQYRQISRLTEDIAAADYPLIVGGDFNTTDQSETYRMIDQYLHNAHWEAGWGFGFSFPASTRRIKGLLPVPALIRIDHIFCNDHFFAGDARTLTTSGGSDHLPVVAKLYPVR